MEATKLAEEIKETSLKTWAMWSREAVVDKATGGLLISPDLPAKFLAAQANNLAMTYAERLMPVNDGPDLEPENIKEETLTILASMLDIGADRIVENPEFIPQQRELVREMLLSLTNLADARFKDAVNNLYLVLEHIDRLEREAAKKTVLS